MLWLVKRNWRKTMMEVHFENLINQCPRFSPKSSNLFSCIYFPSLEKTAITQRGSCVLQIIAIIRQQSALWKSDKKEDLNLELVKSSARSRIRFVAYGALENVNLTQLALTLN